MRTLLDLLVAALGGGVLCSGPAFGQSPTLSTYAPCGGQRGTEVEVKFTGARIHDAQDLFWYREGLEVVVVEPDEKSRNRVSMRVRIAEDCPLGAHPFRMRTARGITNMKLFWVGVLPEVEEKTPNNARANAQKIPLGVTVNGSIAAEDVDWFAVDVAAGQLVHFDVQGERLGGTAFDPHLAIFDPTGAPVLTSDDTAFGRKDPVCSIAPATAGTYYLELREATFGGSGSCHYRMHVGAFPRPVAAFPSGGPPGQPLEIEWIGAGVERKETVLLPASGERRFAHFPADDSGVAPSPIGLSLFDAPNVIEPAGGASEPIEFVGPAALNGVLRAPGEVDRYRFDIQKGQKYDLRVVARALRSPLDAVLTWARPGNTGENDDADRSPDSHLTLEAPADYTYTISIRDRLGRGGPDYFYRIEVSKPEPRLTTRTTLRRDAEWIAVPAGGRMMTVVVADNKRDGDELFLDGLPPGVSATVGRFAPGTKSVPVVLEAAADADLAGALVEFGVRTPGEKSVRPAHYTDVVRLIRVANDQTYLSHPQTRLPVAVTKRAPFDIELLPLAVPLVRGGSAKMKVRIERRGGFKGAVAMKMAFVPPGVTANTLTIPASETDGEIALSAKGSARIGMWSVAVYAYPSVDGGTLRASSALVDLQIAKPRVTAKLGKVRAERGATAALTIEIERAKDVDGVIEARLVNLPNSVTADAIEFTPDTDEAVILLRIGDKATLGKHRVVLQLAVPTPDGPILHYARGEIRVDEPRKDITVTAGRGGD